MMNNQCSCNGRKPKATILTLHTSERSQRRKAHIDLFIYPSYPKIPIYATSLSLLGGDRHHVHPLGAGSLRGVHSGENAIVLASVAVLAVI